MRKSLLQITNLGQNKSRGPTFRQDKESTLCPKLIDVDESAEELPACNNDKCTFIHDISAYLTLKQADIQEECYVFNTKGHCPRGATCRCVIYMYYISN